MRAGHVRGPACSAACELVLVHERTPWGWLTWTVLGDGSAPQTPHRIGVLTPGASHRQRLALRWLTRRPARRLGLAASVPGSVRYAAAVLAVIGCAAALHAVGAGVPAGIAWPLALLARCSPSICPTGSTPGPASMSAASEATAPAGTCSAWLACTRLSRRGRRRQRPL
ncbi:hypothetical protein OHB35_00835 [Streptomyces phaeochromogenes]|uniref:Uncharacterized protein n=1 Tax=Streptomyces phaeochromogenes TaxID=1923 RepID=A0ABZ1H0T5_STRPH|nr:hypothetical protein [Streptomyces phaeochromogenes]WSD11874.1 hypothetical protein OHB35_00835 [Streptomyces phaeochromogenes]